MFDFSSIWTNDSATHTYNTNNLIFFLQSEKKFKRIMGEE